MVEIRARTVESAESANVSVFAALRRLISLFTCVDDRVHLIRLPGCTLRANCFASNNMIADRFPQECIRYMNGRFLDVNGKYQSTIAKKTPARLGKFKLRGDLFYDIFELQYHLYFHDLLVTEVLIRQAERSGSDFNEGKQRVEVT